MFSKHKLTIIVAMILMAFSLTVYAQDDTEEPIESFPVGATITGTVTEVGEGMVVIDGVVYWLSADVDPALFVVGENVSITVILADDVTMSVIDVAPYYGEVESINPNEQHPVGEALAEGLGVEYADIMGWADAEIGFGEIARGYLIANETGLPVEEVLAQRLDGQMGWGQIMQQYDVSPSTFAPGRLISGKLVIEQVDLPEDVEDDGSLMAEWSPEITGIDLDATEEVTEEVASNQGNDGINKFGCDGRGNSCNAPGHNKDNDSDE